MKFFTCDAIAPVPSPVSSAEETKERTQEVCRKMPAVRKVALFGSLVRGDQRDSSDVDLLICFDGPDSFGSIADLGYSLVSALGRDVDCITSLEGSNSLFRKNLKSEGRVIYERP